MPTLARNAAKREKSDMKYSAYKLPGFFFLHFVLFWDKCTAERIGNLNARRLFF